MVTNERQRRYAKVARSAGKAGSPKASESNGQINSPGNSIKPRKAPSASSGDEQASSQNPLIDPKLDQYHYAFDTSLGSMRGKSKEHSLNSSHLIISYEVLF